MTTRLNICRPPAATTSLRKEQFLGDQSARGAEGADFLWLPDKLSWGATLRLETTSLVGHLMDDGKKEQMNWPAAALAL